MAIAPRILLVEGIFLLRPLVTVPLGTKLLKVTPKAVNLMLGQLGERSRESSRDGPATVLGASFESRSEFKSVLELNEAIAADRVAGRFELNSLNMTDLQLILIEMQGWIPEITVRRKLPRLGD